MCANSCFPTGENMLKVANGFQRTRTMSRFFPDSRYPSMGGCLRAAMVLLVAMAMAGCSGSGDSRESDDQSVNRPIDQRPFDPERRRGSIRLNNFFGGQQQPGGLPVNALLWRASLDTLSVIPLASADTFGGTIISDWYTHPEIPTRRIKVSVFVLDQELRSDGVRAEVYVQERAPSASDWTDAGRDKDLALRLEELILTRAREIRSSGISETN